MSSGPDLPDLPDLLDLAAARIILATAPPAHLAADVAAYLVSTGEVQAVAGDTTHEPHEDTWAAAFDELLPVLDILDTRILAGSTVGRSQTPVPVAAAGLALAVSRMFIKLRGLRARFPEGEARDLADRIIASRAREARAAGYRVELPAPGERGMVEVWL